MEKRKEKRGEPMPTSCLGLSEGGVEGRKERHMSGHNLCSSGTMTNDTAASELGLGWVNSINTPSYHSRSFGIRYKFGLKSCHRVASTQDVPS
jgi:hypothetical protein